MDGQQPGRKIDVEAHQDAIFELLQSMVALQPQGEEAVQALVAAHATGKTPHVNPLHTSSDIRNPMVQKGIPTVGFGPFCGDLTQTGRHDEWVDAEDYLRFVQTVTHSIIDWCGVEA